jgi:hypothetical protein
MLGNTNLQKEMDHLGGMAVVSCLECTYKVKYKTAHPLAGN